MNYKIIITVAIFLYCLYYLTSLDAWHFIDYVNLVIHEAGHMVFMLFGYFMTIAGGTILQLVVPLLFVGYFTLKQSQWSASIVLSWLGLNLLNVSVYASDALKMQLPLLTGDKDTHDWNQLLFSLGQLRNTELISNIFYFIGIAIIVMALAWGIYAVVQEKNNYTEL